MTEEREVMEVDVLFVGGGVANLSGALHLSNLIKKNNQEVEEKGTGKKLDEVMITILDKGAYPGAHGISGAVLDPSALQDLVPDFIEKGAPLEGEVKRESFYVLTKNGKIKAPILPPFLNNHGNYVISMSRMNEWLGGMVEENGVDIFPGFAGVEVLYDGDRVKGVRTGDMGIDSDGSKKANFEPGIDLQAKVTVFGEGSRGSLTKTLIERFNLDQGKNPQAFEVGVKEVWELPEQRLEPGEVIDAALYPLGLKTFGGAFIYGMKDNMICIGLLTSLDYKDPFMDPHREFQKLKLHPMIKKLLKEGKMVQYGAKTVPVGGFYSVPKVTFNGGMLVGDSANLFNVQKIKGVNLAMRSGMLAAETIFEGFLNDDFSEAQLEKYKVSLTNCGEVNELFKARNYHQAMEKGLIKGTVLGGIQYVLGGAFITERMESVADHLHMKPLKKYYGTDSPSDEMKGDIKYDGEITFDKETDVYYSGTTHEEKQPPHLKILDLNICYEKCTKEFQNPCVRFCPANVYEMETDEETGKQNMKLNFSNCVHCKTCDVKDPYGNIQWVPPEGGGGPKYTMM